MPFVLISAALWQPFGLLGVHTGDSFDNAISMHKNCTRYRFCLVCVKKHGFHLELLHLQAAQAV